jgi:hypothetical protein
MERENLDMNSLTEDRRKAIAKSIATISAEKMKAIGEEIFPHFDNPWREKYFDFIKENPGATFHHATTTQGIQILYCRDKNIGIWFMPHTGMGPIPPKGLGILKEIVEGKH